MRKLGRFHYKSIYLLEFYTIFQVEIMYIINLVLKPAPRKLVQTESQTDEENIGA